MLEIYNPDGNNLFCFSHFGFSGNLRQEIPRDALQANQRSGLG